MAFDPFLAARVRRMLAADPGITEQRMFGGLAFLRHGLMVMAVMDGRVLARVGAEGYAAALAEEHVAPLDLAGRSLNGFVVVDEPGIADDAALHAWLRRGLAVVATLPPKPPKPSKAHRASMQGKPGKPVKPAKPAQAAKAATAPPPAGPLTPAAAPASRSSRGAGRRSPR